MHPHQIRAFSSQKIPILFDIYAVKLVLEISNMQYLVCETVDAFIYQPSFNCVHKLIPLIDSILNFYNFNVEQLYSSQLLTVIFIIVHTTSQGTPMSPILSDLCNHLIVPCICTQQAKPPPLALSNQLIPSWALFSICYHHSRNYNFGSTKSTNSTVGSTFEFATRYCAKL